jgi:hypothetical protein
MGRGIVVLWCVVVLGLWGGVGGNGRPRPTLWSIVDVRGGVLSGHEGDPGEGDVKLWPMPHSVTHGDGTVILDRGSFEFAVANGTAFPSTLAQAFERYYDVIFSQHAQRWDAPPSSSRALTKLVVTLASSDEEVRCPLRPLQLPNFPQRSPIF